MTRPDAAPASRTGGSSPGAQLGVRTVAGVEVRRVLLGGALCDLATEPDALVALRRALAGEGRVLVASANLDHLHHFGAHGRHADLVPASRHRDEWLVLLDGAPLVSHARRLTGRTWPRLTGSDLLPQLLDLAEAQAATVGVLGGMPEMHQRLRQVLAERWPSLGEVPMWSPQRAELADEAAMQRLAGEVAAAGVDLLVVALGKPRQELWLDRWAEASGVRVGVCFGAAPDFLTGASKRAPAVVQRLGGEWAWRLASEPRRLWRRYLVEGVAAYRRLRAHSSGGSA